MMADAFEEWLHKAEGELRRAKDAYNGTDYRDTVSHLQRANEDIANGLKLSVGLLPEAFSVMDAVRWYLHFVELDSDSASHEEPYHPLVDELPDFLDPIKESIGSMDASKSLREVAESWNDDYPAHGVEAEKSRIPNPNPDATKELDHLLKDCEEILRLASAFPRIISTGELKLPKTEVARPLSSRSPDSPAAIDRVSRRTKIRRNPSDRWPGEEWVPRMIRMTQTLHLLLVLAVLDVYLSNRRTPADHQTRASEYGRRAAAVQRFDDFHSLLGRSLALARAYRV